MYEDLMLMSSYKHVKESFTTCRQDAMFKEPLFIYPLRSLPRLVARANYHVNSNPPVKVNPGEGGQEYDRGPSNHTGDSDNINSF